MAHQVGANGRTYAAVFYPSMQEIWPELYSTTNIRVVEVRDIRSFRVFFVFLIDKTLLLLLLCAWLSRVRAYIAGHETKHAADTV